MKGDYTVNGSSHRKTMYPEKAAVMAERRR
jgi:hypothetical protein